MSLTSLLGVVSPESLVEGMERLEAAKMKLLTKADHALAGLETAAVEAARKAGELRVAISRYKNG
jgi:hypothetical protein